MGYRAAGSVGNHAACEVLSVAVGVTASIARMGSLPVAPKQSLAWGGGAEQTDDRCRGAGVGRAGGERVERRDGG